MSDPSQQKKDDPAKASFFQGVEAMQRGDKDIAIAKFRNVLELNPAHAPTWNNLGVLLAEQENNPDEALSCFQSAIELDENFASAYSNLAQTLHALGDLEDALAVFEQALDLAPDNPTIHNRIAILYKNMQREDLAEEHLNIAITIAPDYAEAYNNRAMLMWRMKRIDEAECDFKKALEFDPKLEPIYFSYAALLDFREDFEALKELLAVAKINVPHSPSALLAEARFQRREKDFEGAINTLQKITKQDENVLYEYVYNYDKLKKTEEAFAYLRQAHEASKKSPEMKALPKSDYLLLLESLQNAPPSYFQTQQNKAENNPVFVVGFPRSGTTLLDQMLSAHADTLVTEENPAIETVAGALSLYPTDLSLFSDIQIQDLQEIYFKKQAELVGQKAGKTIIDENPLNMAHAGLIHALFPRAKIVFLQRHPCDVVLSCLFQKFQITPATRHFLSLQSAAELYRKVISLWLHYTATLPLPLHTVRYEDLVQNKETEMRKILEFIDLPWNDCVLNHHLQKRQAYSASYAQVREPVHTHSVFRWKAYRDQLSEVLPILLPLAETLGYELD